MKNKNNIFLMLLAIATLLTAVVGATYAYFASVTDGTGVSTDLDVEAQANTAQFTAEGGTFGFTVTGADMMQANAGSLAKESTGSLEVNLTSPKLALCTFDVKFGWNEGSSYTPTTTLADGVTEFGVLYEGNSYGAVNNAAKVINFDKLLNNYNGVVLDQAKIAILESDGTEKTETINLNFKVQMYNLNHDQSALAGTTSKTYNGKFYIDNVECTETKLPLNDVILASNEIYPDNIPSTYVDFEEGIDFNENPEGGGYYGYEFNNGTGLYYTNVNTEGNETVYYFRNNSPYVSFATGPETVCTYNGEIVYDYYTGDPVTSEAGCASVGRFAEQDEQGNWYEPETPYYNLECGSQIYCHGPGTLSEVEKETVWRIVRINEDGSIRLVKAESIGVWSGSTTFTNSTGILADYYVNYLKKYESLIADAGFCNDKSVFSNDGSGTVYYGAYNRIDNLGKPQFGCPNSSDLLTVANGGLTYPIGFLTADEMVYAGSSTTAASPSSFYLSPYGYLDDDVAIWTMTPQKIASNVNYNYTVNGYGLISWNDITTESSLMLTYPVINLKADVKYLEGAGTRTNPYKIMMNEN